MGRLVTAAPPADILRRILALAPHLHPSVSHRAQWEALLRDVRATIGDAK